MDGRRNPYLAGAMLSVLIVVVFAAGCAAGDVKYESEPAGFFTGLWHGFIMLVAFIVSLFNDGVKIYEMNNSGNIYNLGFVLGAMAFLGGGCKVKVTRDARGRKKRVVKGLGIRIGTMVKDEIKASLDESDVGDPEWQEIADRIKSKVKREILKWAESDSEGSEE